VWHVGRCNVLDQIEDVPDAEDGGRCWTIPKGMKKGGSEGHERECCCQMGCGLVRALSARKRALDARDRLASFCLREIELSKRF